MFELKDYQGKALAALDGFFRTLKASDLPTAWQAWAPKHEKNGGI